MHDIEPHYHWRNLYQAETDENSPFYGREYSEIYFSNTVYNYYIHPQWDDFGSSTLYVKLLFADYDLSYCILEFIGEWNDCLYNDIMFLKRNVIEELINKGISRFILIGENVFNFHYSDDLYYQEWREEIEDGWISIIGFLPHVIDEIKKARIHYQIVVNEDVNNLHWRTMQPEHLLQAVEKHLFHSLPKDLE